MAIWTTFGGTETTAHVFTSPFFFPIYGLLAINLIFCAAKHVLSARKSLAFLLIHIGILLLLGGASWGHFSQIKGFMQVYQQSSSNMAFGGNISSHGIELPFMVFLDRFWIQYYPQSEHSKPFVLAFQNRRELADESPHLILPLGPGFDHEGDLEDFHIVVEEFLPHAEVKEEQVEGPILALELNDKDDPMEFPINIGETIKVDGLKVEITPRKIYQNARVVRGQGLVESQETPLNPALELEIKEAENSEPITQYLFSNLPDFNMDGGNKREYRLLYHPPRAAFTVQPSPDEEDPLAAKIRVSRDQESRADWYFLNHPPLPDSYSLFDDLIVRLSEPEPMVKDYKSKLSLFEGDEIVASKVIEVNHPLTHKGYMLYQHSYDPVGNEYTVLEVVRDPGFWWVLAGFLLLMMGVIQKFYLDPLLTTRKKRGSS